MPELNEPKQVQGHFAWPPRAESAQRPPPLAPHQQLSALGTMINSVELDLLGRESLAFDVWAKRNNWQPDTRDQYCWRCAGSVGPHEQDGEGCASCRTRKLPWDRALRLGGYQGRLRSETLALKFHAWRPGGRGLGQVMGNLIRAQLTESQIPTDRALLVPIPTHPWRRIRRGIDHTMVITQAASASSGCSISGAIRARYRPEQVGLSATARAKNMKDAFRACPRALARVHRRDDHSPRVWILIDDVRTTGATFSAGAKALRRGLRDSALNGQAHSIWVCSVGVALGRERRNRD
jgi:predicted amidophosphoribosyltransferase